MNNSFFELLIVNLIKALISTIIIYATWNLAVVDIIPSVNHITFVNSSLLYLLSFVLFRDKIDNN